MPKAKQDASSIRQNPRSIKPQFSSYLGHIKLSGIEAEDYKKAYCNDREGWLS